ncbi:hypothetical protein [Nonomuraea diastatica]|uniref:hypothetical protein n=1 Tax=Nonomuraea diastatica TaxID=1848329 RepID=UPI0015F2C5D2|nr:hypothetical protein [Nonomuraea diastatica]
MSEDAPVNTGAARWPDPDSAYLAVRRMQTKLHRWATEDSGRRFGDLVNLVYDRAFLVHAWERVSTNMGAKTPGIDRASAAQIEAWIGVEVFLGQIRDQGSGVVAFCPVSRSCEVEDGEGAGGIAGDVADGLGDVADSGQA